MNHNGLNSQARLDSNMRTMRIRATIAGHLKSQQEPQTFRQILDWLNDNTRNGSTPHQLCNVLAKNPEFIHIDTVRVRGTTSGKYDQTVWVHEDYLTGGEEE